MELLNLSLVNFRNFSVKKIAFEKKLTIIIGPNGSGKSNILEAIALFSGMRPVRIETDFDLVKFGKNEVKVEAKVFCWNQEKVLTINMVVLDGNHIQKAYLVDSIKKRLADLVLNLSIVIFSPQDLELVTGSPSLRRHHLDDRLSSVDRQYHRSIGAYNKIVVRRNKILQRIAEGKSRQTELDFWDGRILEHAKFISQKRKDFFEFLNFISGGAEQILLKGLSWDFKQSLLTAEKLFQNRERDIAAGITLSGPHRDDFKFIFNREDLAVFGSRGEQRLAVLELKLAELEYYQTKLQARPILALDDIFSELDWEHRRAILSVIGKQQTIITATETDSVPKQIFKKAKIVELK